MSKKLLSSVNLPAFIEDTDKVQVWDHTELEKFLEENEEVECYVRDGYQHYLVIPKPVFTMGGAPLPPCVGNLIYEKFDNYDVILIPQGSHSGYIWRNVFRVVGGLTHKGKNLSRHRFYAAEFKDITDETD